MNRIPTEGLKHKFKMPSLGMWRRLNEQNPDRGIETPEICYVIVPPIELE